MKPEEERDLVERVLEDPEVFGKIFDLHFHGIFRYVLLRTADAALAEELTSRVFFKALRGIGRFRPGRGTLGAWLFRIAENEVRDSFRRRRRRRETALPGDVGIPWDGRGPEEELAAAEETVARHHEFRLLHECMRKLKPVDQALLVLRYFEGKGFPEIARTVGMGEGALRMRNLRALRRLKGLLVERGVDHEEIHGGLGKTVAAGGDAEAAGGSVSKDPAFPAS